MKYTTPSIKVTCVFQGDYLLNLYVNSGHYPHTVAQELKEKGYTDISVKTMYLNISNEQLVDYLLKNTTQNKIK